MEFAQVVRKKSLVRPTLGASGRIESSPTPDSFEFPPRFSSLPGRRADPLSPPRSVSNQPPPGPPSDRHPFLEGDEPAPHVAVKKHAPAAVNMESRQREWRPSIRPMQPISSNAAGITNAQRNEMAMREIGGQLHRVPTRPADDKQDDDPHRGRLFTPNSHLLHTRRVPYGFDERDADRGSAAALPEADCFGRGPSPVKRRPLKSEDSSFSFHGEGTVSAEAAEDDYRPCKARTPSYEWSARRAASANPNALIADREEIRLGANRGAGSIRPHPDAMSIARGTAVVGSEWGAPTSAEVDAADAARRRRDPWGHDVRPGGIIAHDDEDGAARTRRVDARAAERAEREAAIRKATEERFDDAVAAEYEANRARCVGQNRTLGDYLYEVKGRVDDRQTFYVPERAPALDLGPETFHSKFY